MVDGEEQLQEQRESSIAAQKKARSMRKTARFFLSTVLVVR